MDRRSQCRDVLIYVDSYATKKIKENVRTLCPVSRFQAIKHQSCIPRLDRLDRLK